MSEVIAVGSYMRFWWPELPWIPGIVVIAILLTANLISVKWFMNLNLVCCYQVVTIILMIIAGFGIILFGFNHGDPVGFANLWSRWFLLMV